jgi:hypothetical protein
VVTKSGTRDGAPFKPGKSSPLVIRLDPTGKRVWEANLRRKGFLDFEGGSAVATPDGGTVVFVLSFATEGAGASTRLVKLDRGGRITWDWVGRGKGGIDTPFATTLQLSPTGTFLMRGHIYLKKGEEPHAWTGEVDRNGKLLRDETDEANPRR